MTLGSLPFAPKPRQCKACPNFFVPISSMQVVCGPRCAMKKVRQDKMEERAQIVTRKAALKTIPELIAEADRAFAMFIRERDRAAGHACISSGRPLDWSGNKTDAGHYRSRGAASHLRYHEANCHAQSKHDNQWLAGNVVDYRIRLIERVGLEAVDALESNNTPHKWTREELIDIAKTYRAKARQLQRAREAL